MIKPAPSPEPAAAEEELPDELDATESLLELVVDASREPAVAPAPVPERIRGVVVGRLLSIEGGPTVAWAGAPGGARARAFAPLAAADVGAEVAIVFEEGDPARPIVMGAMEALPPPPPAGAGGGRVEALADGRRVVLEAEQELVLACGKASITLTRAGKILIRGAYVSSDATGTHRIRGGTVEIN